MIHPHTHRLGSRVLAGDVEHDLVLAGNDVRHAVSVVSNRAEAAARRDLLRVLLVVPAVRLLKLIP